MIKKIVIAVYFLSFLSLSLSSQAATNNAITLAQNGKSDYVIVVPDDAIPAEQTAAQQLQKYFLQMTKVSLPVKSEKDVAASAPQILVGNSARAKVLLPNIDWNNLGKDGILMQTSDKNLILAGNRPRGSLYAVLEFLENAGCRFWWPGAYEIPQKSTFTVASQNIHYIPPFAYRQNSAHETYTNEEYATMLRENGNRQPQTDAWGNHYEILGWVHTFSKLLPVQKYFSQHPEWYSDPANGFKPAAASSKMPSAQQTDLCLGNPQVLDAVTDQALAWIKQNPKAGYISISQNDNANNYCRDPYAEDLIKKEGSPSAPLLEFVNKVAERIHQLYPDFIVETLAYHYSEKPPKTIRPGKNVLIRLAPISADYGHPINSDQNAKARDNLLVWEKIAPELFIWNYTTNFHNMLMPHPNMRDLGNDLRFFAAHHVTGVFEQGNSSTNNVGDFEPLRAYLIGKLMWNPALDQNRIINEFLRGYYGDAAPFFRQYLQLIDDAFPRDKQKLSTFNNDFSFLTLDVMNQATRLFDKAAAAVKDQKVLSERVAKERFSLDLAWLMRYRYLKSMADQSGKEFLGPQDSQQALAEWKANAERWKVTAFGEHRPIETLLQQLKGGIAPPQPLPPFAQGLGAKDAIDIQPAQLEFSAPYSSLVDDAAASGESAVKVQGDHNGWSVKAMLGKITGSQVLGNSSWKVVALVRVEKKPDAKISGDAIGCGIYDVTNRKNISGKRIPLSQLADGKYHVIEIDNTPLDAGMYVWVGPVGNANVAGVYVDRMILMRGR